MEKGGEDPDPAGWIYSVQGVTSRRQDRYASTDLTYQALVHGHDSVLRALVASVLMRLRSSTCAAVLKKNHEEDLDQAVDRLFAYRLPGIINSTFSSDDLDSGTTTPSREAVKARNTGAVRYILHAGADPNMSDDHEITPLFLAIGLKNVEAARLLLESGAVIPLRDDLRISGVASLRHIPELMDENTAMADLLQEIDLQSMVTMHSATQTLDTLLVMASICGGIALIQQIFD